MRRVVEDERGQAVPLAAAMVAVAAMLVLGIGVMARDVGDAGRARSAADAAALAGVEGDRPAAAALAAANGGVLVSWSREGRDVIVRVRVGAVTAAARATGGEVGGLRNDGAIVWTRPARTLSRREPQQARRRHR